MTKRKFSKGDWVQSTRVKHQGAFTGQIIDVWPGGEYVVRDAERRRWLRKEDELSPAKPKAANDNEQAANERACMQHWRL